ncbi:antiviral RADAR system accessory protein RdrD [Vibrio nitrifigilis]|uniref:Uncharacterized protein n=1 Tax=Vibrio nitrifigilis TaxID=2789781 RepID=A0ABS0GB69_9VIBR|nr:antiviral RADAR system accessory protein RdrD [Vibrio nitrifigilis]MBF8999670.1 hypothetical protein [Vibrio nitrifigilis]
MQPEDIKTLTSFDDIIKLMDEESTYLKKKSQETEWQRYVSRRIPVYAGIVTVLFLISLLMTTIKAVSPEQMDQFLAKLSLFTLSPFTLSWYGVLVLVVSISIIIWSTYSKRTRHKELKIVLWSLVLKVITIGLFYCVIIFENKAHSFISGIVLFGTVTLSVMLADRTFGYTRRYERYDFFSQQAEALAIKFASLKAISKSSFDEQHLNECLAFYEQLRLSKYKDTVSDSFYLLSQIEKKVAG